MNIAGSPRPTLKLPSKGPREDEEAADLDFYSKPPDYELTLDEFEEFALSRLKVLRKIEELKVRNATKEQYNRTVEKVLHENLTPSNVTVEGSKVKNKAMREAKKKLDVASHFILRAAYCKTDELRRWFLTQEHALFKYKLERLAETNSGDRLRVFLKFNDLNFDRVSNEEKARIKPYLLSIPTKKAPTDGTAKLPSEMEVSKGTYYKIPFHQASDLVASRQCYVSGGYAYVPLRRIVSIVTARFRMALSKSLAQAGRVFSTVASDFAPIAPLLSNMNSQYMGNEYGDSQTSGTGEELTSQNVESHVRNMPLCMSQLHAGLKRDNKLRHHGRLQYGRFLKAAGLSMEESILFFQKEFTKIMSNEKFQKEYTYNIRHMYGKEGKRVSYKPFSCIKIILGDPPQSADHHGCPYKHYDDDNLAALMTKMQIGNASDRDSILSLKRGKHFNLACQKHFEVTHPNAASVKDMNLNGVGDHPNAWFAASVAYHQEKSENNSANVKTALGKTTAKK